MGRTVEQKEHNKLYMREYMARLSPEKREAIRLRARKRVEEKRSEILEKKRLYNQRTRERRLVNMAAYRAKQDRAARNAYMRRWDASRRKHPIAGLAIALRRRMGMAFKNNSKTGKTLDVLGCSIEQLRGHLQGMFRDGMTWNNYGRRGWHIDHRRPLKSFDLRDVEQVKAAFHFTNLQPLWWHENLKKAAREP